MKVYGTLCPGFNTAYLESEGEETSLERRLTVYPDIYQAVDLILRVINNKNSDHITIQFRYDADKYAQETIDKLNTFLLAIIKEICGNPDILLKEIVLEPEVEKQPGAVEVNTSEDFNF
jgi:hypothetical protein